jgi:hypothetical protein
MQPVTHTKFVWWIALALGAAIAIPAGCPPSGGDNNNDTNGTTGDNNTNGTTADNNTNGGSTNPCDERHVTSVPPAGYYQFVSTVQLQAQPDDSALAKISFQAALCSSSDTSTTPPLYQIGDDGQVLAIIQLMQSGQTKTFFRQPVTDTQLTVTDGCIASSVATTGGSGTGGTGGTTFPGAGPCGGSHFAITKDGMEVGQPQGEYICVQVQSVSACTDCYAANGVWHETLVTTGYYVAEGSIDGVSLYDYAVVCDHAHQDDKGSVHEGDRVDFTWTMTTEYRSSQSPEELGYTEIVYTP